jgi:phosphoribosylamine--glycine ligase
MKILVIGSGAREHAIAEALHRSSHQPHVIVSPGNSGIAREFETIALDSF